MNTNYISKLDQTWTENIYIKRDEIHLTCLYLKLENLFNLFDWKSFCKILTEVERGFTEVINLSKIIFKQIELIIAMILSKMVSNRTNLWRFSLSLNSTTSDIIFYTILLINLFHVKRKSDDKERKVLILIRVPFVKT